MEKIAADLGVDLLDFGIPQPAQQIDHMYGVVEDGAPAGQLGVREPAARHGAVVGALDAVDFTEQAGVQPLLQLDHGLRVAHGEGDLQLGACCAATFDHGQPVGGGRGDRLFAEYGAHASGGLQYEGGVGYVLRADDDAFEFLFQQALRLFKIWDAILVGEAVAAFRVVVVDARQRNARHFGEKVDVAGRVHVREAKKAKPYLVRGCFLFVRLVSFLRLIR